MARIYELVYEPPLGQWEPPADWPEDERDNTREYANQCELEYLTPWDGRTPVWREVKK